MTHGNLSHEERPRTDDIAALPYRLGRMMQRAVRTALARRYDVTVHGEHQVPGTGPVLLAPNHLGILDGPLLGAFAPRMVHAVGKREVFVGIQGHLLRRFGQIPVDRSVTDPLAVRTSIRVLRDGGVLSVYPEGARGAGDFARIKTGVGYLAMVTGAPIIPVALLGTRMPGAGIDAHPPRGARVDIVYGDPIVVRPVPFPRRQAHVRALADEIGEVLRTHVQKAVVATGNPLPGAPEDEELV